MAAWDSPKPHSDYANRRTVPRFSLIATVEVVESSSDMRLSGRLSEVSRKGAYIDVLNALPTGTLVKIRVSRDCGTFATGAKVIYVQEGMGMGVAFMDTPEDQLNVLDAWLAELGS
jgi:PilZ domain